MYKMDSKEAAIIMTILIFVALLLLFITLAIAPLIADLPQKSSERARRRAKAAHPSSQGKVVVRVHNVRSGSSQSKDTNSRGTKSDLTTELTNYSSKLSYLSSNQSPTNNRIELDREKFISL
jgi:biopolymer transport protein ExbD